MIKILEVVFWSLLGFACVGLILFCEMHIAMGIVEWYTMKYDYDPTDILLCMILIVLVTHRAVKVKGDK